VIANHEHIFFTAFFYELFQLTVTSEAAFFRSVNVLVRASDVSKIFWA